MSVCSHKNDAPSIVGCAIITVSDTRTIDTDKSGDLIQEMLQAEGHTVCLREIVKDEGEMIQSALETAINEEKVQVVLVNGGTGIASRDITIETIDPLFDKEIVGFGELFRMVSYLEDIGSAAMMSRAVAGTYREKAIFIMPGSSGAVKLAMEKLILNELGHIVRELQK